MPGKCTISENGTSRVAYKDWISKETNSQHKARCHLCQKSLTVQTWGNPPSEAVLSALPDNQRDTRFWTVSPSPQIRV